MRIVIAVLAGAAALAACVSARPVASTASIARHVADAQRLAGQDLKALLTLCEPVPPKVAAQDAIDRLVSQQIARPAPEPGQAFDNLYYVGAAWVSAWALKTSDGVILIDALNNGKEAAGVLEPAMRKVGLNPADIRYALVTHAHGDHYGGAQYLVQQHRTRVAMSDVDWAVARVKPEVDSASWDRMPQVDTVLKQGEALVPGDTRVTAQITPGHTVGTLSPVFEVKHRGRTHKSCCGAALPSISARTSAGSTAISRPPSGWRRWRSATTSTCCCRTTPATTARSRSWRRCAAIPAAPTTRS